MPIADPTGDRRRDLAALLEFGVGPFGFLPAGISDEDRESAGHAPYRFGRRAESSRCPTCDDQTEVRLYSAPGYVGLEHAWCPSCGWTGEP